MALLKERRSESFIQALTRHAIWGAPGPWRPPMQHRHQCGHLQTQTQPWPSPAVRGTPPAPAAHAPRPPQMAILRGLMPQRRPALNDQHPHQHLQTNSAQHSAQHFQLHSTGGGRQPRYTRRCRAALCLRQADSATCNTGGAARHTAEKTWVFN